MKLKLTWLMTLFMALVMNFSFGQEKTVTGTITTAQDGLPLPGASVIVKGTTRGAQTDFDGKYSIEVSEGEVLVFSYVGMQTTEQIVGASNTLDVSLNSDVAALDEIIITGQGSGTARRKLSTTVDVVSSDLIEKLPAPRIDQLLQASSPSAQIRLSSGQPGTASIIRTRGPISASASSTPVIIVDGVRVDNLNSNPALGLATGGAAVSALNDIPQESIERIEYIKGGAATTLYGADAANGVIQIITKKGKAGQANVFFESSIGVIKATDDFLFFDRTADLIFETGLMQEYRFGFNGGSEDFGYNFSGSLYGDDSFNDVNEQVRRSLSAGFRAKITDKLQYNGSFSYSGTEFNLDFNSNTSFSRYSNYEGGANGNIDELSADDFDALLQNSRTIGELVDINNIANRFTISNRFTYDFTDSFKANFTIGTDYRTSRQQELDSNELLIALGSIPAGTTDQAFLQRPLRQVFTVTSELNLTHNFELGDGNFEFNSQLGGQFFRTTDRQNTLTGDGGVDGTFNIDAFATQTTSDFLSEIANYGVYFLETIDIYNVFTLDFGARLDQNTAAGEDADAIFLPRIGGSYVFSDHDFYQSTGMSDILSFIKFRANYGEATIFPAPFAAESTVVPSPFFGTPSLAVGRLGNPTLQSEIVATTEFGGELGFFNGRLNFSATRYSTITEDALFTPPRLPSEGAQLNQVQNLGEIENKGWEYALSGTIIESGKHKLTANVSYNTNDNVVTDAGGAPPSVVGGFTVLGTVVEEGFSLGYLRGTSASPNGDGTYTFDPNTFLGDTFAPNFGTLGLNYSFGGFSLFATADYQFGGQYADLAFLLRHIRGVDDTGIPEDIIGTTSPFNYVNYFVFDNDFLKVRNLGASYSFGDKLKPFSNVTVSFTATNPFNWTSGLADPETTGAGIGAQNSFASGGLAFAAESVPRQYITTLKFQF